VLTVLEKFPSEWLVPYASVLLSTTKTVIEEKDKHHARCECKSLPRRYTHRHAYVWREKEEMEKEGGEDIFFIHVCSWRETKRGLESGGSGRVCDGCGSKEGCGCESDVYEKEEEEEEEEEDEAGYWDTSEDEES
jgi:hypothetical protein